MTAIDKLLAPIYIPSMVKVSQKFERPVITDIAGELLRKLNVKNLMDKIQPRQKVAITLGSRGISNMPLIIKLLIDEVKNRGAFPFLVPAMGSHGGATAEGQKKMVIGLGYTEEYLGAPILSSMETIKIGIAVNGLPVFYDKNAFEADWTILANRIKPHTSFRGDIESGLLKMTVIGLGKQKGADICHELGFGEMAVNIPEMAKVSLEKGNILFGVGVLENPYHETCLIEVLEKNEIFDKEAALQAESKRLAPKIHFSKLDIMVIDEIGKNISGTGFDTNVAGRYHTHISGGPQVHRLAILDVTDASGGNANGLGIADFTTKRVFDKFSFENTYPNALTSTVPASVRIPMVLKNDKQVIQACVKTSNHLNKQVVTVVRIKNTNSLDEIQVSENLIPYVNEHNQLEVVSEAFQLPFDENGNLF